MNLFRHNMLMKARSAYTGSWMKASKLFDLYDILIDIRGYTSGEKEGLYQAFFDNGQKRGKCHYRDGKLDGIYQEWNDNGEIGIECHYLNDKYDGLYKEWDIEGNLIKECTYLDGEEV